MGIMYSNPKPNKGHASGFEFLRETFSPPELELDSK
jgi:hypothetical protein